MLFEKDEQQNLAALIDRAQALIDVGKWREAIKPLCQALVIEPENGEVHCRISFAWLQLGDFEQALAHADSATQCEPMNEWGHRLRGRALLRLGRKSEALASAEEGVRLAPHWQHTLYILAETQIANRRLSEARQSALRAREIAPENPESHVVLAMVAMEGKSWPEAEEHLRKALSLNPISYVVFNNLGVCLLNQKREREAIEMFRQAARANPTGEVARNNLKSSIVKYPVPGRILLLVLCPLIISAIARGHLLLSIFAVYLLLLVTCLILSFSFPQFTSLRSQMFKQLSPEAQNFIRAERRRESGYHAAGMACGLSAVILMWWIAIWILNPSGPNLPRSATSWTIFAGLWACLCAGAAIFARRAISAHMSLWKWFTGLELNG